MSQQKAFYSIATPFGSLYGPESHQHLGIDVLAADGTSVYAPVKGTVSFFGKVPKADGRQVFALTIKTADSSLVSLSPLESDGFKKEDPIAQGQKLGIISPSGDPSLAQSHLHMSLRVNKRYVDPSKLVQFAFSSAPQASAGQAKSQTHVGALPKSEVSVNEPSASSRKNSAPAQSAQAALDSSAAQLDASSKVENEAGTHSTSVLSPSLPLLHEQTLAVQVPQSKRQSSNLVPSAISVQRYSAHYLPQMPQASWAGLLFLIGLTLTLAGWGGYTLLDGKFDIARKLEQLAVRGQR